MDKISCITITKNRVHYLKKCISYYLYQTHENKELVIIYYNTDPDTEKFLFDNEEEFTKQNIKFFKFIEDDAIKLGSVRNLATTKATGDWLAVWDDDDWNCETRLEKQLEFCKDNNMIGCTLRSVVIYSCVYRKFLLTFERYEGWECTLFVRRDKMLKYKNLATGEDTPLVQELLESPTFKTMFNPDLYVYIFHKENVSGVRHKQNILDASYDLGVEKTRMLNEKLNLI